MTDKQETLTGEILPEPNPEPTSETGTEDTDESAPDDPQIGTCDVCGEDRPLNGERDGAIEHGGQVLCGDCTDVPVVFEAHCELWSCEWTHRVEGRELNRYALRQRIQSEANNHETENRVLRDDPSHEAIWEEINDG